MTGPPQPTPDPIAAAIRGWLADRLGAGYASRLRPDGPLVSSGLLDSASVLELVLFLEQRFAIRIDDREVGIANFDTLAALAALVRRLVAGRAGAATRK
jgi:acyl carrier protein